MRTLFWKIFISFWSVVAIFIVIAVLLLGRRAPLPETSRQAVEHDAFAMYARSLGQTYDVGGKVELYRYLQEFKRTSRGEAYLLDRLGNEVAGQIQRCQFPSRRQDSRPWARSTGVLSATTVSPFFPA
jgi:hypothetical protein